MRTVTAIEPYSGHRYKVYLDGEFAFLLYRKELSDYRITENGILEEETCRQILEELLPLRAKKRSLKLLEMKSYTERQLRDKLRDGLYPPSVIDEAIAYVKSYHYIDDYAFACQYIEYHKENRSRRKLEEALTRKGIDRGCLARAMTDAYDSLQEGQQLELTQARRLLEKKHYTPDTADMKERQKMYTFLMRRGISSDIIRKVLTITEDY
jgi:regulatory protein